MRIRDPHPPGGPDDDDPDDDGLGDDGLGDDGLGGFADDRRYGGAVSFRVPTGVLVAKFAAAALLAVVALVFGAREQVPIGLAAALGLAVYAARDVLARERLSADAEGLVAVSGFATHRRLDWPEVERVTVDSRLRFGARSEILELDTGDHIFLFSRYDLGVAPEEALAALEALRPA